jgi:transmembrane sensor
VNQQKIKLLFERYLKNQATREEIEQLLDYFDLAEEEDTLQQFIAEQLAKNEFLSLENDEMLKAFHATDVFLEGQVLSLKPKRKGVHQKYIAIAASVVLLLATGLLLLNNLNHKRDIAPKEIAVKDVPPGNNKATLTLGSGKTIILEEANMDKIALDEGIAIRKGEKGELIYQAKPENKLTKPEKRLSYHTIKTPKGCQYEVVLPDGSKVWLNAASSITFPVSFNRKERRVQLKGEAYFDVKGEAKRAFFVQTKEQLIHVLGTQFNVKSYANDENVNTTLIEGKVSVTLNDSKGSNKLLKPGQQASINKEKKIIKIVNANMEQALAWKNGWFMFEDAYLKDILKTVARWYEIEVDYSKIPAIRYTGAIPRDVNLSKVLAMLEKTGNVSFKIKDGKVEIN